MKKIIFFISVIAVFSTLWMYKNNFKDNSSFITPNTDSTSATKSIETVPVSSNKESINDAANIDVSTQPVMRREPSKKNEFVPLTEQDIEETRLWMEKKELEEYTQNLYSSYSESVLITLADQGDLVAIKVLYRRLMQEFADDFQTDIADVTAEHIQWQQQIIHRIDEYVYSAILHGDKESLGYGVKLFERYSGRGIDPNFRAMTLDHLAFYEFANMRGDVLLGHTGSESTIRNFERSEGSLQLSDAEKTAVQNRARQIYDELENKRIELGLGAFDNTVSEWELKRAESMRQQMRDLQH